MFRLPRQLKYTRRSASRAQQPAETGMASDLIGKQARTAGLYVRAFCMLARCHDAAAVQLVVRPQIAIAGPLGINPSGPECIVDPRGSQKVECPLCKGRGTIYAYKGG